MTTIRMFGAEFNTLLEADGYIGGDTVTISTIKKRSGAYSLRLPGQSVSNFQYAALFTFVERSEIYAQMCFNPDAIPLYGGNAFVYLMHGSTVLIALVYHTNGTVSIYVGDEGGTLLGTSVATLQPDTWNTIEVYYKGHVSSGSAILRIAGTAEVTYSGVTSVSGLTTLTTLKIGNVRLGGTYGYWDDIIINDTNIDDALHPNNSWSNGLKIALLKPSGVGNYSQWTSVPAGTTNFMCVDELPPSIDDYVTSTGAFQKDSYVMENCPDDTCRIYSVRPSYWVQCEGTADEANIKRLLRIGGINYLGTSINISSSFGLVDESLVNSPATGTLFTVDEINNLEFGMEVEQ